MPFVHSWLVFAALAVPRTQPTAAASGRPIAGISCDQMEGSRVHIHQHLVILDRGKPVAIPADVGRPAARDCLYWLHTHDFDHVLGIIHIESPTRRIYRLGQFMDIWHYTALWDARGGLGYSVDATFVEALRHARPGEIHAYVNGKPIGSGYRGIVLAAHKVITIEIGRPLKPPTTQATFPQGE